MHIKNRGFSEGRDLVMANTQNDTVLPANFLWFEYTDSRTAAEEGRDCPLKQNRSWERFPAGRVLGNLQYNKQLHLDIQMTAKFCTELSHHGIQGCAIAVLMQDIAVAGTASRGCPCHLQIEAEDTEGVQCSHANPPNAP